MTNIEQQLCSLLEEKTYLEDIKTKLAIDEKTLLLLIRKLTSEGYLVNKSLNDKGNIYYYLKHNLNSNLQINMDNKESLRTIFISDLHLGRKKDKLKYLEYVYNYAIQNNIGIIFNLGDLIQGINYLQTDELKYKTVFKQIEYVIKKHPYDKNITNIILYGNHDYNCIKDNGLNIGSFIENNRYDLISVGFTKSMIEVDKNQIHLHHNNIIKIKEEYQNASGLIIFKGHSHKSQTDISDNIIVSVPSLSDAYPPTFNYKPLRGFLDVTFYLNKKSLIESIYIKKQIFSSGIHLANEEFIKTRKK